MTEFILNNQKIVTAVSKGSLLIDFIREHMQLKGTKSACREGDCGSCAVLEGSISGDSINYRAIASCITPIGNVQGKHIVTIEGLNQHQISPIQDSLVKAAAVQCGYCTPGIVLSLTAYVVSSKGFDFNSAKDAVAGNICRCTGYKSIESALHILMETLIKIDKENRIQSMVDLKFLPPYFIGIQDDLMKIQSPRRRGFHKILVGGGTDLFVQKPELLEDVELGFLSFNQFINKIKIKGHKCSIGAACKISDLAENALLNQKITGFKDSLQLIGSQLIRNMATVGGNLANASPIGDLSIIFLALDANLHILTDRKQRRRVKLRDFFKSYKCIDLLENEYIESVNFELPQNNTFFNFEKVSKRKYLDIASVNSAMFLKTEKDKITEAHVSVGGVSPIPLYLKKTSVFLHNKTISAEIIQEASHVLDSEISPIDDVRGSEAYKRLLARQLFVAHFFRFFPGKFEDRFLKLAKIPN